MVAAQHENGMASQAVIIRRQPIGEEIERVLIGGDLARLDANQRVSYYNAVCESIGVNPLTRPFDYITLNGKLTLYARRDCTDQLRNTKKVSIQITAREHIHDLFIVTARISDSSGRVDESTGAVNIANLKGEALANALMKAETKAKRRATLSFCGLGIMDETEIPEEAWGEQHEPEERSKTVAQAITTAAAAEPAREQPKGRTFEEWIHDVYAYTDQHGFSRDHMNEIIRRSAQRQQIEVPGDPVGTWHEGLLAHIRSGGYNAVLGAAMKKAKDAKPAPTTSSAYVPISDIDIDALFSTAASK